MRIEQVWLLRRFKFRIQPSSELNFIFECSKHVKVCRPILNHLAD